MVPKATVAGLKATVAPDPSLANAVARVGSAAMQQLTAWEAASRHMDPARLKPIPSRHLVSAVPMPSTRHALDLYLASVVVQVAIAATKQVTAALDLVIPCLAHVGALHRLRLRS